MQEVACPLQPDGLGGWRVPGGAHKSIGLDRVETDATQITIWYDFTAASVITLQVTPDEQLAIRGYTCGASVGLDHALIWIGQHTPTGYVRVDPTTLNIPGGNLWVRGLFEVTE